ncbi:response regulator of citrate/malate metabolism [Virgibacillus halotolerans]|uniref:response regulator n=1 Tax=Virgibacillus halotolerans TaxID=1071053 RepID=UPI0019613DAE|nr:response regulator [Virgibacillus halotolerans]MBM7599356.1 response regulator of citrate/malate metabolism [Virgibacillus halotolerans]
MNDQFGVLIIEDDFRIADIHRQFVEKVEGFFVLDRVKTAEEALDFLRTTETEPDLVLLDIYIPDVKGLDLFWQLRTAYHEVDIVIVTAAMEVAIIEATKRGGIFDYLVKPADASRFASTLTRYKRQREFFMSKEVMNQKDIDSLMGVNKLPVTGGASDSLPKGIDPITLEEITYLLAHENVQGITAVELSKKIGTSRSTARRYLEYLVSVKKIRTTLLYGNVGRPERQYILRETYEQNDQNRN